MTKPSIAAAVLLAACAPAAAGAGDAADLSSTRAPAADMAIVPVDASPREAVLSGDVTVVTYLDIPQAPLGCALVARLLVESGNLARVRGSVTERAGELGATLLIVANRNEVRTETSTSRAGVGLPIVSNRYTLDAYDCR